MSSELRYQKRPQIYVYSVPNQPGLKVGYTERVVKSGNDFDAVKERVEEGLVKTPNPQYKIEHYELAITKSGKYFTDHTVHKWLKNFGVTQIRGEWYDTNVETVRNVIVGIKNESPQSGNVKADFKMRPEQEIAVEKTAKYFFAHQKEVDPPRYLWNAKMRFGKTFTSYELAKKMGWNRILVLTYKPGVEGEWKKDLYGHQDFDGWQFIEGLSTWDEDEISEDRPVVWFASYQDVLGKNLNGEVKARHKKMHETLWDCIYVDEYHFGAWRESAKELTFEDDRASNLPANYNDTEEIEKTLPIKSRGFLYLSGTPFRALTDGEFSEDQIFNWTYADEQRAKAEWKLNDNPYLELPQIVMLTYQMPESLREVAMQGEFNEFDLNKFFTAIKENGEWKFKLEKEVQKFLNILHGTSLEVDIENRFDHKAPALPFEDARLLSSLRHTFWFLPSVGACKAMEKILSNDPFFSRYTIIRAAGTDTPGGKAAKNPVENAIKDGLSTNTITLSCGKLTTGVTVSPWSGVLFLRNTDKPETYFQTAFRAQSPWVLRDADDPMRKNIMKSICYVLDFAPSRALKLVANYSNELGSVGDHRRPEERLEEFVHFLPILCYDGHQMQKLNANEILDISTYGTASTMLARRWQSARLVDTTTVVMEKILNNPELMAALEKIEDFRNLRSELTKTISREKALQETKRKIAEEGRDATPKEKKEISEKEKEQKTFKTKMREKLLKFITRVPVFMYLTDYREQALVDVIRNIEPELFIKVTGLAIREFDMMCEVGAFNQTELNAAIAQFRRFEDASLEYVGGRAANSDQTIGLFDTVVSRQEADDIIERELA
jgi:putative restriction enzyme